MSRQLLWTSLLLCGCCATDRVILLPDSEGKVGKVAVLRDGGETVLENAYATANLGGGAVEQTTLSEAEVRSKYQRELATLPQRPVSYVLYFLDDSDELTADSRKVAPTILAEIAKRPAAEVVVIGHTDRTGSIEHNDKLSLQRARALRDELIALGFDRDRLKFAGRGEREPAVRTRNDVEEPRNRRAEINVR